MKIYHHHEHHHYQNDTQVEGRLRDVAMKLDLIIQNQEKIMLDTTALKDAAARLKADDVQMLALLKSQRDTNDANAAKIADLVKQIADLQAGQDTTAIQNDLNAIKDDLSAQADAIEAQVAANPATPDLPPAPAPDPGTVQQ